MEETPAQREAENVETVEVTYLDETFTLPASPRHADGDVIDAVDDGKLSHAVKALLGSDWPRFKKRKPTGGDYRGLLDAWAAAGGFSSAGE